MEPAIVDIESVRELKYNKYDHDIDKDKKHLNLSAGQECQYCFLQ